MFLLHGALKLYGDIWIWRIFGLIQQFGICSGLNEVYQLLWRLTTCGFGRRNSLFEFSSLNSFLMTADSQLLVDFEF